MRFVSAGATVRGPQHEARGEARQDALTIRHSESGVLMVLADGAGSAPRGGAGAALAVRTAADALGSATSDEEQLEDAAYAARGALLSAAKRHTISPRDLATTLMIVSATAEGTTAVHVGDGAAVIAAGDTWLTLSPPERGLHAGTTHFLTDADGPALRISTHDAHPAAIAAFTDGIERMVLTHPDQAPHAPFFDKMTAPLQALDAAERGRHAGLSAALSRYLSAPAVAERSEDDKTLAIAVKRDLRNAG